jgi:prepilin peptidase dependent protein B
MNAISCARPSRATLSPGVRRGLSIIELMVGITISLFILAGASLVLTTQLDSNRRLLLEAQVQQDLRTTADMISRDIRRAGYWGKSFCNVQPASQDAVACPTPSPYNAMTPDVAAGAQVVGTLEYRRSTDFESGRAINFEDDVVDAEANRPREHVGFKFNQGAGTIEYMAGNNNWQTLTDPAVLQITQFSMTINSQVLPVPCAAVGCQALGPRCGGPMSVHSREVTFTIVGRAVHDTSVERSLRESVRLRNAIAVEQCP